MRVACARRPAPADGRRPAPLRRLGRAVETDS